MRFAEDGMYVIVSINSSHPNLIKIAKELFPIFMFTFLFFFKFAVNIYGKMTLICYSLLDTKLYSKQYLGALGFREEKCSVKYIMPA